MMILMMMIACIQNILTIKRSATAIPRYAHEISDNSSGSIMVRTLLFWGAQSSSHAIKAAVAQSLAALCTCENPPFY